MEKDDRDRKRRQKALNRVEKAYYVFVNEITKTLNAEDYYPDLDDLEALARYFEGAAKAICRLNKKAVKQRKVQNGIQRF